MKSLPLNRRKHNRNQNGKRNHQPGRNHVYDSQGPNGRVRGNAQQISEKYTNLDQEARRAGNYIQSESFYQFAEHYNRIVQSFKDSQPKVVKTEKSEDKAEPTAEVFDITPPEKGEEDAPSKSDNDQ